MHKIFGSEESEWSAQGYIDEKELHDSIVDINKQNQNAVNEQLLNGIYDGITSAPVDVLSGNYVDIDTILKDDGRLSGNSSLESVSHKGESGDSNTTYNNTRYSEEPVSLRVEANHVADDRIGNSQRNLGSFVDGHLSGTADVSLNFSSESRTSQPFSDTNSFEFAGKALNLAEKAADLALNSPLGMYHTDDAKTAYMAEYDAAEKVLGLAVKEGKNTIEGVVKTGYSRGIKTDRMLKSGRKGRDVDGEASEAEAGVQVTADSINTALMDGASMSDSGFQSNSRGDASVEGLIDQLGIVTENAISGTEAEVSGMSLLVELDAPVQEEGMSKEEIPNGDISDLCEQLGVVSDNEMMYEREVEGVFEGVAEHNAVIVPDTEDLSDGNLISMDGNHAVFEHDSDGAQRDLEKRLGIFNKKEGGKSSLSGDFKDNVKKREKAIARERFQFMLSVLLNENKNGVSTDSGLGRIVFGGAARRISGTAVFFGRRILNSILPYIGMGLLIMLLILGLFLASVSIIALPLFVVMNVSNGAGRELTVMNQDFGYVTDTDYVYNRAVSLYEDFCYEREDIVAAYSDGLNEFVYDSNTATDYFANAFSLVWAYLTTVDDEGISSDDDLIVPYPSDHFDMMQCVSKELFYYETETITKTVTVTDANGHSTTQTVYATRFTFIEKNYLRWFADKFLSPSNAAQTEYDLILSLTEGASPTPFNGVNLGDGTPPDAYDDALVAAIFAEGEKYLGVPYRLNPLPTPPTTFCCDVFVKYVFSNVGIPFPPGTYTAQGLYEVCVPVSPSEAKAGDLVFFTGTYANGRTVTHVGIYCGNGVMLHSGDPVKYTNINTSYWQQHFYSFGRYGVNN